MTSQTIAKVELDQILQLPLDHKGQSNRKDCAELIVLMPKPGWLKSGGLTYPKNSLGTTGCCQSACEMFTSTVK